jgi:phage-related protein
MAKGKIKVYEIIFYKDKAGKEPVLEYINELVARTDKDSRVKFKKIMYYIDILEENGKGAGEPYVKPLDGDIWELRPLQDLILFAGWDNNKFILLHYFVKKTQKTPLREIEQAKRNFEDYKRRAAIMANDKGTTWADFKKEIVGKGLLSQEEITENKARVAIVSELIKVRNEKKISQQKFEELESHTWDEVEKQIFMPEATARL